MSPLISIISVCVAAFSGAGPAPADTLSLPSPDVFLQKAMDEVDEPSRDKPSQGKWVWAIQAQLSGRCTFNPDCYDFFRDAVRETSLFPALIFTADRITRSGRIGSAGRSFLPSSDGLRHEGVEAYLPRKRSWSNPETVFQPDGVSHGVAGGESVSGEYDFALYLLGNDLRRDASTLLSRDWAPSDTLDYLRGRLAFEDRSLAEASAYLGAIGRDSPYYEYALFHSVVADAHLGRYDEARDRLEGYSGQYQELARLQRAGLALLRSDPAAFRLESSGFTHSPFALDESEQMLGKIGQVRFEKSGRSPVLAAAMSAVIPGSGKIYAGKTGEGMAGFIMVGTLAAITAENWVKAGPTNWKTLLFGTAGTLFYIGNIYGSYISVSLYNEDFRNVQDTAVLYHIHIPLRSIFD